MVESYFSKVTGRQPTTLLGFKRTPPRRVFFTFSKSFKDVSLKNTLGRLFLNFATF